MKNNLIFDFRTMNPTTDSAEQEQEALIGILIKTVEHFFGGFQKIFGGASDPRDQRKINYPLASLCFAGVLMFLLRLGARRQVTYQLRKNEPSREKFEILFGVDSFPHGDTLNDLYLRLSPQEAQEAVTGMAETLIRKKVLSRWRLRGIYYVVAVDGTGTISFDKRHCPYCLTRTHGTKTIYYHEVLEAKLVTPNGFAFSLMTEFIENPGENPGKQDCELKAFYRLAQRLKERFPRLPLCISLDSLFAGGPTFDLCNRYGWKFLIVHKDNLPSVEQQFEALQRFHPECHLEYRTGKEARIHQQYRWVNNIPYIDTENREHSLCVLRCLETKPDKTGQIRTTRFQWVTNFKISQASAIEIANDGGRSRWIIENEGFNVQKNGGFELEHVYSNNDVACKIFYLLLQIACTLFQLIQRGSLFRRAFPTGVGSAKNIAFRLLEAWRNLRLARDFLDRVRAQPFQIRFDTS
ncbi:hypothetical protein [Desulforhabdus amnigena]|uniref:Transposase family protein n=1 Tax=Desulforhabdus amnigena TaxID=40218 RepID=A0A9W6D4W9_9BACT|nr:hypothetical protein [Desulforhabdus amnigena]GLI33266.1 hypothetical protein DAMNIGENAA_06990 [Desulforhabdus amnigena]GLI33452.1 hypothetical protein DAMNIGENAA_08850 [Desulforhabdus amnigena]GLI34104.1 hypothetical protein DAMNIGENAA_15370 [Desulforhabdus amnigena]GLI35254.1 hypothetical protein DAMNIGENAA_26870 [Desulforhabdus amnigena]GLI35903.1 hypothetical protein DAMNIGENAA_33360 [Desulforhabdus amnigena]